MNLQELSNTDAVKIIQADPDTKLTNEECEKNLASLPWVGYGIPNEFGIVFIESKPELWIGFWFISPQLRGKKGIDCLWACLAKFWQKKNCSILQGFILNSNKPSLVVAKKLGFTILGQEEINGFVFKPVQMRRREWEVL